MRRGRNWHMEMMKGGREGRMEGEREEWRERGKDRGRDRGKGGGEKVRGRRGNRWVNWKVLKDVQGKTKEVKKSRDKWKLQLAVRSSCSTLSSGRGREQQSQQNSMAFVIGRLGTEAVKLQPLTAGSSFYFYILQN